jgi:ADP-ribose pyrophosphatase YjhB (NUDIX family)
MDVARALGEAISRADLSSIAGLYDAGCIVESVFLDDEATYEGRETVVARWRDEFARSAGALPGGRRLAISRVAGIETGWGWVRADWVSAVTAGGIERRLAGYSHFWIDHGRIFRHRSVTRSLRADEPAGSAVASSREYPTRPVVGVGGVVLDAASRVLLVKRRHEPLAGQWSLPGGALDVGETLQAGTAREILEETGLVVDVGPVVDVFDRILVDDEGRVRYHFVLVDYLCTPMGGELAAASDVADARFVGRDELARMRVTEKARDVVDRALALRA